MLKGLLSRVVGDSNEKEVRKLQPLVDAINARESEMERRSEAELGTLTDQFRARLAAGAALDDLLPEAFAAAREAAKRTVSMRPFDVQLIGGIVLHQGKVAEMKTGEGKTLVATLPIYLNALTGQGVHLVTVNDYLARRDTLWMGPIYHLLGLRIGLLQQGADQPAFLYDPSYERDPYPGLRLVPRKLAYAADITYGTNNEFGFDYLRDNLALMLAGRVQRSLQYAIVDEVDNIFIDEARTPLIISGASDEPVEEYSRFAAIARQLEPGVHYELDEKERTVFLSDEGLAVVERETGIENVYDEANYRFVHYMEQALKAQVLFQEGRDYIRQRKHIVLIDQHTGRLMPNRRLSEGLHQAIEAKEAVPVLPRDVTSATITIQNYFRMYKKLAGMSGTAVTEGEEFFKIYKLDVVSIPTNRPMIRQDGADVVYRTEEAKLRAVAREILARHSKRQPILVGTTSVEMSERLSSRLSGERLQVAALAPRIAYALQDANLAREERDRLRETMNANPETMNSAAWRKMVRDLGLDPNALSADNLKWIADYLELPDVEAARHALELALREGIPHQILNAKEHTREAAIIARAGEPGAVTIATNMAGRGVDIRLGGELTDEVIGRAHQALRARGLDPFRATSAQMDTAVDEVVPQYAKDRDRVLAVNGLHILGTERHEARRIDNQLRGRSGRQGEPGSSRFYLSLEDDLMRRFGRKEMLSRLMETIGDDFPIEHGLVSKTIERAQTSVEGYNFDIRKHLLEYDDVLNRQRDSIYGERVRILQSDDVRYDTTRMLEAQVDEYVGKAEEDSDQQRLMFAGLDDVVPLILPAANAPFPGPVKFGSHLTAFPPFTLSFVAELLADKPLEAVQAALRSLSRRAAAAYGEQLRQSVGEMFRATSERYQENLERYQALLEDKIDDFIQLAEERQEVVDIRRVAQHLERTYPLKLTTPRQLASMSMEDLREHWRSQIEVEFHAQTVTGLIDRARTRLPFEAAANLERVRPSRLADKTLASELERVRELVEKPTQDNTSQRQPEKLTVPRVAEGLAPSDEQISAFIAAVKEVSSLDPARLDRLVGHVLGAQLDDLLSQFEAALAARSTAKGSEAEASRQRNDLERLRESVLEGKKGGRADLVSLLRQLNSTVHLELDSLEGVIRVAVAQEYDKWAQRQIAELEADSARSPLQETSWSAVAEHLLATQYTQKQQYDREHRRQFAWVPRLPLSSVAQASVEDLSPDSLRDAVLTALRGAIEQRELTWGAQELQRWRRLSVQQMDEPTYDGLIRFLGEDEIGEHGEDQVDDLPPDLSELLRFTLALKQVKDKPLGALPYADDLMAHLDEAFQVQILDTPLGEMDKNLQERIEEQLRRSGHLEDQAARARLVAQPIRDWDPRTLEQVAGFLGGQYVEAHKQATFAQIDPLFRDVALNHLRRQRRFIDETRVQRFLVHQGLDDLPPDTRQAALLDLARARLDHVNRRKLSNLDVTTRQLVLESLQRQGLMSDPARRTEILGRTVAQLGKEVRSGFGAALARQVWDASHSLDDLAPALRDQVLLQLRQGHWLDDPERLAALPDQKLGDLDSSIASGIRAELVGQLQADLAARPMEDLPAATREAIHKELVERSYFVDQEKVGWYERRALTQLPAERLQALERQLGRVRLAELSDVPFHSLPEETQSAVLAILDGERLLVERAERLRLTQAGKLSELPDRDRGKVAGQLGRLWLVQIRDRRPPLLPERERQIVWSALRADGFFADQFKEELFAYQRLEEFGPLAQSVEQSLTESLNRMLDDKPISALPPSIEAQIRMLLKQAGYFLNSERLRQAENLPPTQMPDDLRSAIEAALGEALLASPSAQGRTDQLAALQPGQSLQEVPIGELPAPAQDLLWRFLDATGYFLDEGKRSQLMDRRLADLGAEIFDQVSQDLAGHLLTQIGHRPVSELDESLRQGLREAVEAQGTFESKEAQSQVLSQPLGSLPRADLDALALEFGGSQLRAWADQALAQLPASQSGAIVTHLQAHDWFVDRTRFEGLKEQRLRNLAGSLPKDFFELLRRRQTDRLRVLRLSDLERTQRHSTLADLYDRGLRLDEGQMRPLRSRKLREVDRDAYDDLLRFAGSQVLAEWGLAPIQDLEERHQRLLASYLGRRIMGRIERRVLLFTISRLWIDYLTDIEDLRRGIGLEAFGQRDPLVEYRRKASELFVELADNIRRTVVRSLFRQPPEPLSAQAG